MKKFILKIGLYFICIFIGLELLVRVFHLYKDRPIRYLDEYNVEKWVPNQTGTWVIGNRKMHSMNYSINDFGFNSVYDSFTPSKNEKQIALIGDSFIQGFHQDIYDSLGQKLENLLNEEYKVFEFGYTGWDLADQLHLLKAYNHLFEEIEYVFVYMQFTTDLRRDTYEISNRFSLDTPLNRFLKKIKIVVYLRDIGLMDPITQNIQKITNSNKKKSSNLTEEDLKESDLLKLNNFKALVDLYEFDKEKNVLLLDYSLCSTAFINYLQENNFKTIDFSKNFEASNSAPTYIYDQHWNNHGRSLIANLLKKYVIVNKS